MVLYLVASPFQYFRALDHLLGHDEEAVIVLIRYRGDRLDYRSIFEAVRRQRQAVELIEVTTRQDSSGGRLVSRLVFQPHLYWRLIWVIGSRGKRPGRVIIGDRRNTPSLCVGSLFGNVEAVLGDGADVIWTNLWGEGLSPGLAKRVLLRTLGVEWKALGRTVDAEIFSQDWNLVCKLYRDLPQKNEAWIFGTTIPTLSQNELPERTQKAVADWRPITPAEFVERLRLFTNQLDVERALYFPHRNEKITEAHRKNLRVVEDNYFAEVRPLMVGYVPRIVVAASTAVFSFCNIARTLGLDMKVYFLSSSEKIDRVYEGHGGIPLDIRGVAVRPLVGGLSS